MDGGMDEGVDGGMCKFGLQIRLFSFLEVVEISKFLLTKSSK